VYADYSSVIALAAGVVPSIALDTIAAQTLKSAEADQKNRAINPITRRQNQLMIFPNPNNNGTLYVKLGSADESTSLNIIDLTGRVIYSKMLINIDGTQQLDIGKLKRGIYIVNIAQGNVIYNCKLIVE
jgi:hypothetical protein